MEDMMRPFREWQKITEAVAQNRASRRMERNLAGRFIADG
jgi:hypothetical protein